ncbi:hypothetical protein, partial [Salmonella sp. s55004]|uniref:hypothetical protein n=1 Tax=Salmonella sp. s55004 TaxID=3159675 RepID=UPI00397F254D
MLKDEYRQDGKHHYCFRLNIHFNSTDSLVVLHKQQIIGVAKLKLAAPWLESAKIWILEESQVQLLRFEFEETKILQL